MLRSATFSSRLLLALGVGMVGALSGCQSPPPPCTHCRRPAHGAVCGYRRFGGHDHPRSGAEDTGGTANHGRRGAGSYQPRSSKPGDRLTFTFNDAIAVRMATPGSPPVGTAGSETREFT